MSSHACRDQCPRGCDQPSPDTASWHGTIITWQLTQCRRAFFFACGFSLSSLKFSLYAFHQNSFWGWDFLAAWGFDEQKFALNQLQKRKNCPLLLPVKPSKEKLTQENLKLYHYQASYMKYYGNKFYGITFLLTSCSWALLEYTFTNKALVSNWKEKLWFLPASDFHTISWGCNS